MDEKEKQQSEGQVKVSDRRRFTTEGDERPGVTSQSDAPSKEGAKDLPIEEKHEGETQTLSEVDFSTFILSLATSAQVHLGAIPNPATGKQEKELSLAKQMIDIIGMLEEKTKGNLVDTEGRLLQHILFDLRMMYMEAIKGNS